MKRKKVIVVSSLLACIAVIIMVYASSFLWNTTVAITIQSSNSWIKVYSDANCTQVVTSLSFPTIPRGTTSPSILLYVKNTHPNATFTNLYWNSTAGIVSNNTLSDTWSGWSAYGNNLGPGQVLGTSYYVYVLGNCPLGTYNWTLSIYTTN